MILGASAGSVFTPTLCVPWVALVALAITAWAFREGDADAPIWRRGVGAALLFGAALEGVHAMSSDAVGGQRLDALGVISTPWTAMVDGCAALIGALTMWGAAPSRAAGSASGAVTPRAPVPLRAVLGVVMAASGVAHAAEFTGVVASLSVLVVSLFVAQRAGERCQADAALRAFLWCLLGLALIFAGTSTLSLERLPSRMMMVFTRWGGAQERLLDFRAGADVLPGGLLAQLRGEVIRSVAPASLSLAGIFVLLAGALSLLGAAPFRLVGDARGARGSEAQGLLWLGAVLAGAALLVSLFLGPLHALRMVREPYGWTGVLPTIGALTVAVGAARALGARSLSGCARAAAQVGAGVFVLSVATSASFLGQAKYVPREAVRRASEEMWARVAAEASLAGGVGLLIVSLVFAGLVFVATSILRPPLSSSESAGGADGMSGLMTRAPFVAVALLAGAAGVVGVVPGVGSDVWFDVYRGLGQHRGMGWTLGVVAVAHVSLGVGLTRRLLVVFDPSPVVEDRSAHPTRGPATAWAALLAGILVAGGPLTGASREVTMAAASGIGLVPGSERRGQWARAAVDSAPKVAADNKVDAASEDDAGAPAEGSAPATRR